MKKKTILFLCSGNTCRSAIAAAYMKKIASESNVRNLKVLSAGTCAENGTPASENTKQDRKSVV